MTVDQLLSPRYKVIAVWPCCNYNVGDLIETIESGKLFRAAKYNGGNIWMPVSVLCSFNANIRRMDWWEDRKPEDMPRYLRFRTNGLVRKVKEIDTRLMLITFDGGRQRKLTNDWEAVIEQDYIDQGNKKNNEFVKS